MPGDGGRLVAIAVVILIFTVEAASKEQRLPEWISKKKQLLQIAPSQRVHDSSMVLLPLRNIHPTDQLLVIVDYPNPIQCVLDGSDIYNLNRLIANCHGGQGTKGPYRKMWCPLRSDLYISDLTNLTTCYGEQLETFKHHCIHVGP